MIKQVTNGWCMLEDQKMKLILVILLKKLNFFLDASFKPNDVIDVNEPPFQITRRGWGEFPIRVQLHFVDPRNKPTDIIHHLKLDKTFSGLQTLGAETPVDIELNRQFFEKFNNFTKDIQLSKSSDIEQKKYQSKVEKMEDTLQYAIDEKTLQRHVSSVMNSYPLILSDRIKLRVGYSIAPSIFIWSKWNIGKQKSYRMAKSTSNKTSTKC